MSFSENVLQKFKAIAFLLVSVCSFMSLVAQTNLVPNSSFETLTSCPTGGAQWNCCSNWNNVNLNMGIGAWGTPDFYTSCGTGGTSPPSVFSGTCTPRTGNSMMGVSLFNNGSVNCREYISCPLTCSMFPGNTYTLSFWLNNGTFGSPHSIRNIGVCFSAGTLTQSACSIISATPQCEILTNAFSTSWVQYTFAISPTSIWNTLTFGSFRTDAQNNVTQERSSHSAATSFYAYYFVDDIQVLTSTIPTTVSLAATISQPTSCASKGSVTIVPSNTNVSMAYYWYPGGQTTATLSNLSNGVYTVQGSYQNSCGIGLTNQTIAIQNPFMPIVSLSASAQSLCTNHTLTINANVLGGSPGPYTYAWFGTPGTSQFTITNFVWGQHTFSASVAGANGCAAEATISVYFYGAPGVLNVPPVTICNGAVTTLSASSIYAQNYLWSTSQTVPVIYVSPNISTVYTLTGSIGQCSTVSHVSVNVNPLPSINLLTSSITCFGTNNGSATVSLSAGSPPYQISWSSVPVQTGSLASSLGPGVYILSVTDSQTCSSSTVFAIQEPPPLNLLASVSPSLLCVGKTTSLSASASGGTGPPYSFNWINGLPQANYTLTETNAGTYIYSVQVLDANGCQNQKTVSVQFEAFPLLTVTGIQTLCGVSAITLVATGASSYMWNTGSQNAQIVVTPFASTSYTVFGASSAANCTAMAIHSVSVSSMPNIVLSFPQEICIGEQISIQASGAENYTWSLGGIGNIVSFVPTAPGPYTVTGTNGGFCQTYKTFSINLVECLGIEESVLTGALKVFPSPVTAELFILLPSEEKVEQIAIYDLMGKKIIGIQESNLFEGKVRLELSDLESGAYLVRVQSGARIREEKFIKQ